MDRQTVCNVVLWQMDRIDRQCVMWYFIMMGFKILWRKFDPGSKYHIWYIEPGVRIPYGILKPRVDFSGVQNSIWCRFKDNKYMKILPSSSTILTLLALGNPRPAPFPGFFKITRKSALPVYWLSWMIGIEIDFL